LQVIVRFSENDFAQEVLKDIKAGIRRNVSLGYIITNYNVIKGQNDFDTMIVTEWTPYEGSSVSVPADHTVGFKRNLTIEGEKMTESVNKNVEALSEINDEKDVVDTITTEEVKTIEEPEKIVEIVDSETPEKDIDKEEVTEEIIEETVPEIETEDNDDDAAEIKAVG
jgi:hypothetical protein